MGVFRLISGNRVLTMGGTRSVDIPFGTTRVIAHSHPSGRFRWSGGVGRQGGDLDVFWNSSWPRGTPHSSVLVSPSGAHNRLPIPPKPE